MKKLMAMLIVLMLVLPTATFASVSQGDSIVAKAKTYEGGKVHYVFGRNDPQHLMLDCSSFTKMVFGQNGIYLTWGSKAQSKQGSYVSKSNLKPGDLVFFSVSTPGQINHVGIYTGNGMFTSNLPRRGVIENSLNSSYWKSHYITARRFT